MKLTTYRSIRNVLPLLAAALMPGTWTAVAAVQWNYFFTDIVPRYSKQKVCLLPDSYPPHPSHYITNKLTPADCWLFNDPGVVFPSGWSRTAYTEICIISERFYVPSVPDNAFSSWWRGNLHRDPDCSGSGSTADGGNGGGSGQQPTWFEARLKHNDGLLIDPDDARVPLGESQNYTSRNSTTGSPYSNVTWSINTTAGVGFSSSGSTATAGSPPSGPAWAGSYDIMASDNASSNSAAASHTAVKVKSLTGGGETCTDANAANPPTIYVAVDDEITFTATPDPSSPFPQGQPTWQIPNSAQTIAGGNGQAQTTLKFTTPTAAPNNPETVKVRCGPDDVWKTLQVVALKIDNESIIPSYYADAESNVPLVFSVQGAPVSVSDLSNPKVTFKVDDTDHVFSGGNVALYSGDLISEDFSTPNLFTTVIKESAYDSITVSGDITTDVSYSVAVKVNMGNSSVNCASDFVDAERFGDKTIPVYEIGVSGSGNGSYNITGQVNHKKGRERKGTVTVGSTDADLPWTGANFSSLYFDRSVDQDANYSLEIKYDTNDSFPFNGHPIRCSLVDERRQGYALIYYGRKVVGGAADIVDLSNDAASVHMKAFENVTHYFTYEWGQDGKTIHSQSSYADTVLYVTGLTGTVLTVVGAVNAWNPLGWGALTAASAIIGIGGGTASAIMGSPGAPGKEWASVTMYGGYVVRDKSGSKTGEFLWPSSNQDKIAERLAPSSEGYNTSGANHENWDVDLHSAVQKVKVGDLFSVFVSGSIEGGSPTGTIIIFPLMFDYELQVALTLDVSQDPHIQLWE